jgi:branched-chain amino acid transport system permease protein
VGVLFGLPSLRIKGFYLAVATLAAQFFLVWLFNKVPWFYNYSASGQISAPERTLFGIAITGANTQAWAKYLFCAVILFALAWLARNLTRGVLGAAVDGDPRHGHRRRDHRGEPAARQAVGLCGIVLLHRGVRGAVLCGLSGRRRGGRKLRHPEIFLVLFMIIIGGLGRSSAALPGRPFWCCCRCC